MKVGYKPITLFITVLFLQFLETFCNDSTKCAQLDVSITQKVEHDSFHREIKWLLETNEISKKTWLEFDCRMALCQTISNGLYVDPDQAAELNRTGKLSLYVEGEVDIEKPAHEAKEHLLYIFINDIQSEKLAITVPVHLRYHRGQLTGGFSKIILETPSLLLRCSKISNKRICGKGIQLELPCDSSASNICLWKNITYERLFEAAELFVPVGDLDHYPFVAVITLLLGCAGCIYVLSILANTAL